MYCKASKGAIAYDTPFAKSKVPFARTIATFRRRSFKPSVVVLYTNAFMGFSGDAHIQVTNETGKQVMGNMRRWRMKCAPLRDFRACY